MTFAKDESQSWNNRLQFIRKDIVEVIIKVKVFVPAFIHQDALDGDGMVSLEPEATLSDLYKKIKIPLHLRLSFLYAINYEQAKWNAKLHDGDVVTFFFPISGG